MIHEAGDFFRSLASPNIADRASTRFRFLSPGKQTVDLGSFVSRA